MKVDSLRSRVILHLAEYNHVDLDTRFYDVPFEMTQDGVAVALGISRAYASLVLGRLEKTNTVEHRVAQVRGCNKSSLRNVYRLTGQGKLEHGEIMRMLEEEGLTPEDVILLDINHCSTEEIMSLPREQLDVVGWTCVARKPIRRADLPPYSPPNMPFNVQGCVYMKPDTRRRILEASSEDDVLRYHSLASDWCMDTDLEIEERLYHLVKAHRYREAERMVTSDPSTLVERSNGDSSETLLELACATGNATVCETAARAALSNGMPERAGEAVSAATGMDECVRGALLSEAALDCGRNGEAMELALESYRGDGVTGIPLGRCMISEGRFDEARVYLSVARRSVVESGYLFELERVLAYEAEAAAGQGNTEEAWDLVSMAEEVMKRKSTGADLDRIKTILGPPVRSEDGVRLQVV